MEIYLDNSATTKPLALSVAAAVFAMQSEYGNPSSLHRKGFAAEQLLDKARNSLAKALSCDKSEVFFTSGATEANNLGIIGLSVASVRRGKRIITTAIEHPSVLESLAHLEKQGFEIIRLLPNSEGEYTPQMFAEAVNEHTILVCCMQVNNEVGLILPVFEIAKAVKQKNPQTAVFVDAVQAFLKLPIKLKNSCIDLLSVSGHKVHAPKGIGALYIKRGIRILPQSYGGGQQGGVRHGTEPMPLIAAFAAAVEEQENDIDNLASLCKMLKNYFISLIDGNENIKINSKPDWASHIISISVKGIRSEIMLHFLEQFSIYVSSGSACAKGKQSHVLAALNLSKEDSDNTLRISFCKDTTKEMLDELQKRLNEGIKVLAKK